MKTAAFTFVLTAGFLLFHPYLLISQEQTEQMPRLLQHNEVPDDPYLPYSPANQATSPGQIHRGTTFTMVQVNVDGNGENILGDAANEPSIAIDPVNPDRMVIGWRQFDNVNSNFRQAGYGYTSDGGVTWTFPGVIEPGIFRSDPVLDYDTEGNFYFNSLTSQSGNFYCKVFISADGGAGWSAGTDAHGGDKQWMTLDRSGGAGNGNIYSFWTQYYSSCFPGSFTRSADGGNSFEPCELIDGNPFWGTMTVDRQGILYVAGAYEFGGIVIAKSSNAQVPGGSVAWDFSTQVNLDGSLGGWSEVNPEGLLGQAIVDVDRSNGPGQDNIYVVATVQRASSSDPADVMFSRSTDGGFTWSSPVRINDDPGTNAYQWFGTMSVSPDGRIDVIWLDTRDALPGTYFSALYYSWSDDQGQTWSANEQLSDPFDPHLGWPQQQKMGDYFDMESDETGAHLSWANTLNGEQDVYYSHIIPQSTGIEATDPQSLLSLSFSPNPCRGKTTLRYYIPREAPVQLTVTDLTGCILQVITDKTLPPGVYSETVSTGALPAGYYICRLSAGAGKKTAGLVVMK